MAQSRIGYGTPSIVTDGLVLLLDAANPKSFVSGSTTWNDLSGYRNNGTLVNGVGYSGSNAGVLVFDGVNDSVSLPSITLTTNYTISMWVNISNSQNYGKLVGQNSSLGLFFRNLTGLISFYFIPIGDHHFNTVLNKNMYYNLTFVTSNNNTNMYVNNVIDTITLNGTPNLSLNLIANDASNEVLGGKIPIVQVYNRALTQDEITQNYNSLKGRYL
jgi:hypothetical protein